jgi:hypothetical protein
MATLAGKMVPPGTSIDSCRISDTFMPAQRHMGCQIGASASRGFAANDPLMELVENFGLAARAAWPGLLFFGPETGIRHDARRSLLGPGIDRR